MSEQNTLFFSRSDAKDSNYKWLRDRASVQHIRERIEALWMRYQVWCPDDDTIGNAARDACHAMIWQMYLACSLDDYGFALEKTQRAGPDSLFLLSGKRHWVEAVVANPGTGPDAALAPERFEGVRVHYGKELTRTVLLRYRSAIEEKQRKHQRYLETGLVGPDEPYVIAVNGGALLFPESDERVPNIVRAVFPINELAFHVRFYSDEPPIPHYGHRPAIEKSNKTDQGNPVTVPTTVFTDTTYSGVSGIFFSPWAIWNAPEKSGDDLIFVHNPLAKNPIPLGTFRFGREYWADLDQNKLNWEHWVDGKRLSGRTGL